VALDPEVIDVGPPETPQLAHPLMAMKDLPGAAQGPLWQ
jgi:hypothetical protein